MPHKVIMEFEQVNWEIDFVHVLSNILDSGVFYIALIKIVSN